MSDDPRTDPADDPFEPLFAGVSRRPRPDEAARDRAFAAVTEEWEALRSRRRRRRRLAPLAVAATVLVGVLGLVLLRQPATVVPPSLTLELAQGHVRVNGRSFRATRHPVTVGIHPDETISVMGASRWRTVNGTDVRVNNGSTFAWRTPASIALHEGQVYVATDGRGSFAVATPYGQVTDVGTRFLVGSDTERVEVAVREGRIELATPLETRRSKPVRHGQAQFLSVEGDRIVERTESASHRRWNWIHTAATGYTTRNPVTMLREIARDLGKELQFAEGVEASLRMEELDGDFGGLSPRAALHQVVNATATQWQEQGDVITVAFKN